MIARNAPPSISDALAQLAAHAIRANSTQPVILERLPGGITARGAEAVARAPGDGHTLLLASDATMVLNPLFMRELAYDPLRDFTLVTPLATMPFALLVRADLAFDTAPSLVQWLKQRPGEANYGSSGESSTGHLAGELFQRATGVKMVHASFGGGTAMLGGLASRQITVAFAALPLALAYHPSRYFRLLAVTGEKRSERLPAVPTLAEMGWPGTGIEGWYGLFSPSATPNAANAWLKEHIVHLFGQAAIRRQLTTLGLESVSVTTERFAVRISAESQQWTSLLQAGGPLSRRGPS